MCGLLAAHGQGAGEYTITAMINTTFTLGVIGMVAFMDLTQVRHWEEVSLTVIDSKNKIHMDFEVLIWHVYTI